MVPLRVAPIQLLNTLSIESVHRNLMYVTVAVNENNVLVMLSRATHNFMFQKKGVELGFMQTDFCGKIKLLIRKHSTLMV